MGHCLSLPADTPGGWPGAGDSGPALRADDTPPAASAAPDSKSDASLLAEVCCGNAGPAGGAHAGAARGRECAPPQFMLFTPVL